MVVSGAIYFTGAFPLLLGGIYWKRASRVGAYLAISCGAFAVLGLKPVKQAAADGLSGLGMTWDVSGIESEHVGLATAASAVALMVLGSLAFPDKSKSEQAQP